MFKLYMVLAYTFLKSYIYKIYNDFRGDVLRQGPKMQEWPKSPLGFFKSVYCEESSPKFQMYNEQKANGALTRENQNANNKSVEKV